MMKTGYIITAALLLATTVSSAAQTLKGSVSVTGEYAPELIVREKVGVLPQAQTYELQSQPLPYSATSVVTPYQAGFFPMAAMGWRDTRKVADKRGYLDIAGGTWLNTNLSAGYRFIDNNTTTLGAMLQFNSTSLYNAFSDDPTVIGSHKRYMYDGLAGLYASHIFKNIGTFTADVYYRTSYFDYYGATLSDKAPTQTLTDITGHLGFKSPQNNGTLSYYAGVTARYFGYRAIYLPFDLNHYEKGKGGRETRITVTGGFDKTMKDVSHVGTDATFDLLLYNNQTFLADAGASTADDYSNVRVMPYYRFLRGLLNVKIGAEVDFTFNAGNQSNRFNVFHMAPDVRFDYRKNPIGAWLHVTGGNELQTLASLANLNYYEMPGLTTTTPVYSPIDLELGALFGPFSGFRIGAHVAYKVTKNVAMGGWYTTLLNLNDTPAPGFNIPSTTTCQYSLGNMGVNISGWQFGLRTKYEYGEKFSIHAHSTYQKQDGNQGFFNGYDRPEWLTDVELKVRPAKAFTLSLDFNYRGKRSVWEWFPNTDPQSLDSNTLLSMPLNDIVLLNAGVEYKFSDNFNLWGKLNNLLNRHDAMLPMQPTGGINFMVGFGVRF